MSTVVRISEIFDGEAVRLTLNRPKGNVIDTEMIAALRSAIASLSTRTPHHLKLIVFEGEGAHFSFGASVEEHRPNEVHRMLPAFHRFFVELEASKIPTAAIVKGQCLGGGCELALFCGTVFCDRTARFGVPEAKLCVFPPIAALTLPWRIGGSKSTNLILTGESIDGEMAASWGLVDHCTDQPDATLSHWFETHFHPKSAVGLRYAWHAARLPIQRALENDLPRLESLYLGQLMQHDDPREGIHAFIDKRSPQWSHR